MSATFKYKNSYEKHIFLVALIVSVISFAQEKGDFELGFNFGGNLSTVSEIGDNDAADAKISFNIAGTAEYYFSDRWGIKAKLIFDNKGWSDGFFDNLDTGQSFITDYRLSYVTVPVMANWHFGGNRNWYLNFGGFIGFLTSAEATDINMDVKDAFTSTDFGLSYGIGYKLLLNDKLTLFFEYDEQFGLADIFENNQGDAVTNSRSALNIGLLFLVN